MDFLNTERAKRTESKTVRPVWRTALATACSLLAVVLCIGGFASFRIPVSYVSIDVNPSVELALNCYDRVITAAAYNEDGTIVLDDVQVSGMRYTEAIDRIVESDAMQPYLSADSALTFTVAADDPTKEKTLLTEIRRCSGCQAHGGQGYSADVSSIEQAHKNGLSFGKYSAYLVLSQYDDTVTAEDCRNMTMSEIRSQIEEHEGVSHNGNGYGGGQSNSACAEEAPEAEKAAVPSGQNGESHRQGHGHGKGHGKG